MWFPFLKIEGFCEIILHYHLQSNLDPWFWNQFKMKNYNTQDILHCIKWFYNLKKALLHLMPVWDGNFSHLTVKCYVGLEITYHLFFVDNFSILLTQYIFLNLNILQFGFFLPPVRWTHGKLSCSHLFIRIINQGKNLRFWWCHFWGKKCSIEMNQKT